MTERLFLCGTRAVVGPPFRVVCATCGGGGTVHYPDYTAATKAAVRDSAKPCPACGAR